MYHKKRNHRLYIHRNNAPMYPNSADTGYFVRKLLNIATAIASAMGLVTAMIALVVLT